MHPIVVVRQPRRRPLHLSLRTPIEVGRECDGLLVADPQVSRKHLLLDPSDGFVTVTDLGSTNGTFLDGHRIDRPVVLDAHQVLQIGDTTMALVLEVTHDPGLEIDVPDTDAAARVATPVPVSIDPLISAHDTPVGSAGPTAVDDHVDADGEPIFDFSHLDDSPVDQRQPMYDFSDARGVESDADREHAQPAVTWNFGDADDDSAIESVSVRPLRDGTPRDVEDGHTSSWSSAAQREERSLLGPVWDPVTEAPRPVTEISEPLPERPAVDPPAETEISQAEIADAETIWADAPSADHTAVEDAAVDVKTADAVVWADDAPPVEAPATVAVTEHAPQRHVVMVVAEIDPTDGLGDGAVDELHALLDRVVDDRSASFGGTVAEHRAGSATVEFADARDALYCALAVRRDVKTHSALHPNRAAAVRVGVHAGTGAGLSGDVAGVAETLARSADGGEILVTPDGCRGVEAEPFEFGATHSVDVAGGRVDAVALMSAASVSLGQ